MWCNFSTASTLGTGDWDGCCSFSGDLFGVEIRCTWEEEGRDWSVGESCASSSESVGGDGAMTSME